MRLKDVAREQQRTKDNTTGELVPTVCFGEGWKGGTLGFLGKGVGFWIIGVVLKLCAWETITSGTVDHITTINHKVKNNKKLQKFSKRFQ